MVTVVEFDRGVFGSLSDAITSKVICCIASAFRFSETNTPPVSELIRKNEVPLSS